MKMVEFSPLLAIIVMAMGIFPAVILTYLMASPFKRCTIMRRLGKNMGIIYIKTAGGYLIPIIKNFDKDIIKHHSKSWVFDKGKVYRQIIEESGTKSEEINLSKYLTTRSGIPCMFCDPDDMLPQEILSEPHQKGISRKPEQLNAVLNKERSIFKMEVLRMVGETLKLLMIIAIIVGVINIAVSVIGMTASGGSNKILYQINGTVNSLDQRLTAIEQTAFNIASGGGG
jgi:hypothetical protein